MKTKVRHLLQSCLDSTLVDSLLDTYSELKVNYFLGKHRPAELEAARFCEAAIRCVQQLGTGAYVPLEKGLGRFDTLVKELENAGSGQSNESIRIHIPRLLLSIYGIRNRRNVGHIGGDVNPNESDSILVVTICDWVLCELIRICYDCSLEEAQLLADGIVKRNIPLVEDIDGFPKVLNTSLSIPDKILAILYSRGNNAVRLPELRSWLRQAKPNSVSTALFRLEHDTAYIHRAGDEIQITRAGIKHVEEKLLSLSE